MRRIITFSLFVFMAFMTARAQNGPQLKVWKKDGSTVLYALSEQPVTTFSDNKLVIKTSNTTVEYPLAEVQRYTYEGVETGIESIDSDNGVLKQTVAGQSEGWSRSASLQLQRQSAANREEQRHRACCHLPLVASSGRLYCEERQ